MSLSADGNRAIQSNQASAHPKPKAEDSDRAKTDPNLQEPSDKDRFSSILAARSSQVQKPGKVAHSPNLMNSLLEKQGSID